MNESEAIDSWEMNLNGQQKSKKKKNVFLIYKYLGIIVTVWGI